MDMPAIESLEDVAMHLRKLDGQMPSKKTTFSTMAEVIEREIKKPKPVPSLPVPSTIKTSSGRGIDFYVTNQKA